MMKEKIEKFLTFFDNDKKLHDICMIISKIDVKRIFESWMKTKFA